MIERGNPLSTVTPVTSQITDLSGAVHRIHDNWVASFRTWNGGGSCQLYERSSDMQKRIQRVKFTKAIARHTKIRDQHPSLGLICSGEPHQRSPNAPKFEDRSPEETEWQEQGAREAAWKLAKNVLKLKEHERATFFSPSENRCLPASTFKLEEREFVVDSRASMHMISRKDLTDAEMDTFTESCNDTVLDCADLFTFTVRTDDDQEFDTRWDEILLSLTKIPSNDVLESLYKLRIRESEKVKTVSELYDLEILIRRYRCPIVKN